MNNPPAYCAHCGAPLAPNAKFCGACGASVVADAGEPTRPASVAQPAPQNRPNPKSKPGAARGALWFVVGGFVLAVLAIIFVGFGDFDKPGPSQNAGTSATGTPPATSAPTPDKPVGVARDWRTYTNSRYGVVVDYPADLFPRMLDEPDDHAGRRFESDNGPFFFVYSSANALEMTVDQLLQETLSDFTPDNVLTKRTRTDGLDVIAIKDNEIVYRHILTSEEGGMLHMLQISWPRAMKDELMPVVERMVKSFHVDPSIPERAAEGAGDNASGGNAVSGASSDTPPDAGPDQMSFRRIVAADYGFAIDGMSAPFSVEIPDYWIKEVNTELESELVFRSPDDDPDTMMFIAFVGRAVSSSAKEIASSTAEQLQQIGGGEICLERD